MKGAREHASCEYITCGGEENELVKSEALATCFHDSGSGGLGELESGDGELGDLEEADIVSDGADDDSDSVLLLAEVLHESGDRDGGSVHSRGDQSSHDGLSEDGVGSSREESEQLRELRDRPSLL